MLTRFQWWFQRLPSRVAVDEKTVSGFCLTKQVWCVQWDEIDTVWVETTDEGPERDNCFLMIQTLAGTRRIPSETPGFPNVATALPVFLEGVDEKVLMQGLGYCENAEFIVYERDAPRGASADQEEQ